MAGAGAARRTLAKALGREKATIQASWRPAMRPFSTRTGNWGTTCTTNSSQTMWPVSQSRLLPQNATSSFARARRRFSSTPIARHEPLDPPKPGEELKITFISKNGDRHTFDVKEGDNILDIAMEFDMEMEGACGGSCACSTCHVIVEGDEFYEKMEEPDDDENDMLDLAFGLTETSRLGCQVKMTKELDGLVVRLPSMTRNLQASDFKE